MFTGIVEEIGTVSSLTGSSLGIAASVVMEGLRLGDSVAVNGVCLTVTTLRSDGFVVDIMPETFRRTNLGQVRFGDRVNLERALALGSRLGGHFVQGHVDGTGTIARQRPEGEAVLVTIAAPPEVMRYVVPKGFIAVDGASLTVVDSGKDSFSVSLVTFTQANITLASKRPGDLVNLEVDILGKYVERFIQARAGSEGISMDFLAENGFL